MPPVNLLWSKPALILYAVIAGTAIYKLWEGHVASDASTACQNEQKVAAVELRADIAGLGLNVVEGVIHATQTNAPAVALAVDSVRHACRVRDPARPGITDAAGTKAQDSDESQSQADAAAEDEQWRSDAADDIAVCQHQLDFFTGLQKERAGIRALTKQKSE